RRRHTRSERDWSSDVCSSDLFLVSAVHDHGVLIIISLYLFRLVDAASLPHGLIEAVHEDEKKRDKKYAQEDQQYFFFHWFFCFFLIHYVTSGHMAKTVILFHFYYIIFCNFFKQISNSGFFLKTKDWYIMDLFSCHNIPVLICFI